MPIFLSGFSEILDGSSTDREPAPEQKSVPIPLVTPRGSSVETTMVSPVAEEPTTEKP